MSTTTITIEDPADYRVGDHFTGSINYGGVDYEVTGALQETAGGPGHLWVSSWLPYVRTNTYRVGSWQDVTVLREVAEFAEGTIIRNSTGVRVKTDTGWVWINIHDNARHSTLNTDGRAYDEQAIRMYVDEGEDILVYDPNAGKVD